MKKIVLLISLLLSFKNFSQAKEIFSDSVWCEKGEDYYFKNKLRKARKCFSKAIELNPNSVYAYVERSITYSDRGRNKKAYRDLQKALSLDSSDISVLEALGLLARKSGNYGLARAYFDQEISLDSTYCNGYSNRGALNLDEKKYLSAKSDILCAIRLNADSAASDDYLNLGYVYSEMGQYENALEALNNCLRISPRYKEAYKERASVYEHLNNPENAKRDKRRARRLKNKKNFGMEY